MLAPALESKLRAYTVSGVAGLGMLCASHAQGAVVYTLAETKGPGNGILAIDLNHDGIVDFGITFFSVSVDGSIEKSTFVVEYDQNGVAIASPGFGRAFTFGQGIGSKEAFVEGDATLVLAAYYFYLGPLSSRSTIGGEFLNTKNKFLGLQLQFNGKTYYGWARVDVKYIRGQQMMYELVDYAYQDEPGRAILAGQGIPRGMEGSLGALALGEAGINLWRDSGRTQVP